jgi:hypothetical protein
MGRNIDQAGNWAKIHTKRSLKFRQKSEEKWNLNKTWKEEIDYWFRIKKYVLIHAKEIKDYKIWEMKWMV